MEIILVKRNLRESSVKEDLAYWMSKYPEERIDAVEYLRKQYHGSSVRLQRSVKIVQRKQG